MANGKKEEEERNHLDAQIQLPKERNLRLCFETELACQRFCPFWAEVYHLKISMRIRKCCFCVRKICFWTAVSTPPLSNLVATTIKLVSSLALLFLVLFISFRGSVFLFRGGKVL